MTRSLLDIFKPAAPKETPSASSGLAPVVDVPAAIHRALDAEAERQLEVDAAVASVRLAQEAVRTAAAAVTEDETRLHRLEGLAEPTNETLLDEATTRRRLAQRRAALEQQEAALSSAQAVSAAAAEALKSASASRVRAELNHESDVILADVDAFSLEIERRQVEHIRRATQHAEKTRVSMVPVRTSNFGEGGLVGLARRMLMRREEEGLAARGLWSLKR